MPARAPLRAVLIGCGRIGVGHPGDHPALRITAHAQAYRASAATELVGVCDADGERARRAGIAFGVPAFDDPAALLAACRPDLVSLCTPDETHHRLLADILSTPGVRGVLAEKPLALTVDAARALVDMADRRGIVLAVNYSRRYAPQHARLAQRIAAGELGRLLAVRGTYTKGIRHNGTHWFDWLRLLAGAPLGAPGPVYALAGSSAFGEDPSPHVTLPFASGVVAQLTAVDHLAYSLFELEILGSAGRLCLTRSGNAAIWQQVVDSPLYAGYRTLDEPAPTDTTLSDTLLHAVNDLADAVLEARPPACTGHDALIALSLADAACRSLASGRPEMPEPVACGASHRA